jgi:ribonuclease BN (tRNA processing enzyme)
MGATIEIAVVAEGLPFAVEGCQVLARTNPHGRSGALAFRIEERGKVVVYAGDAGYPTAGAPAASLDLYRGADVLIHDSTYTPEDRLRYPERGFSSIDDAVTCAVLAGVKKLVLFHYDQDYSDADVDALCARGRRLLDARGATEIALVGAAEGMSFEV